MKALLALLKKEEMALFTSPIAYVVMSVFVVIMGYTFTLTLFLTHVPTLVHLFLQIYVLFLLTVPIITMRLVAEERRLRTLEILLTSPLTEVALIGFRGDGMPHPTKPPTRALSRALPRWRALCTNWKKPRYSGSLSCEIPRCGRSQERSSDQKPSMVLT